MASLGACTRSSPDPDRLVVWASSRPYSSDPLDYDAFIHHVAFRSVLAPLVSEYRVGQYVGVVAESWSASKDQRTWTFKIRQGLRFETGDPITADDVAFSLKRIAFLLKNRKSSNGLLEHFEGITGLENPSSNVAGIQTTSVREVILRFDRPVPKVIDLISFGLYAIAFRGDFDPRSGKWLDPKRVTSSGPYRLSKWDDESFVLALRKDFYPEGRHPRAAESISLISGRERRSQAQLVIGTTLEESPGKGYLLYRGALSGINYVACRSWRLGDSPCSSLDHREALRRAFYSKLEDLGFGVTYSFFPPVMKGVQVLKPDDRGKSSGSMGGSRKSRGLRSLRYDGSTGSTHYVGFFRFSAEAAAQSLGIGAEPVEVSDSVFSKEYDPTLPAYVADLYRLRTGILIDDPDADIRFMFLSKEGIRLPDTDGRIHKELEKPKLDVQRINELIWEQAVIWPVTHFAHGLWAREELDLSMLNLVLPPTDFSWIGWKR